MEATNMLQIHTYESLQANPSIARQMYRDRASQFIDRLKWDIKKDANQLEIDQYDSEAAFYLLWVGRRGEHLGSLRLRPISAPNMLEEHFATHFDLPRVISKYSWEVTRFCISPSAPREYSSNISLELIKGACLFGLERAIPEYVGLCFPAMLRIYRKLGWVPDEVFHSRLERRLICSKWQVEFDDFLALYGGRIGAREPEEQPLDNMSASGLPEVA